MTDVATQACPLCGADVYGTKFCESCGAAINPSDESSSADGMPVESPSVEIPSSATSVTAAPVAAAIPATTLTAARKGSPLWVVTLLVLLVGLFTEAILDSVQAMQDNLGAAPVAVPVAFYMFVAFFALVASLVGNGSSGAKAGGTFLAIGYAALVLVAYFAPYGYGSGLTFGEIEGGAYLLLFLAWGVARPFRGPGYFGILIFLVLDIADNYIGTVIYGAGSYEVVPYYSAAIDIVFILAVVGLSALFERSGSGAAMAPAVAGGAVVPATGSVNGKARASLALALTAIAFNILSHVILYSLGLVISVIALVLLVVAIVLGHLARREIRVSGQRGAGAAMAGMLIGYIVFAIDIVLILFLVFATVAAFSVL